MKGIALLFLLLASTQAFQLAKVPDHTLNKLGNLKNPNPQAVKPDTRISEGGVSYHGQFPWQAMVVGDRMRICNGVLVDDEYVLTITDCVNGSKYITVTLGAQDRNDPLEPWKITLLPIRVIVNEHSNGVENNIAILKIDSIAFSNYIQSVPVSSQRDSDNFFEGYMGTVSGWGFTDGTGYLNDELKFATMELVSNSRCENINGNKLTIGDGNLCAAPLSGTPCMGDGGAPLVVKNKGKFVLVGIVTYAGDCIHESPAVFVRMGYHIQWLMANGVPVDYS